MSTHLEQKLAYAKEQFEVANYGRTERAADELINSGDPDFKYDGLLYKGLALQNLRRAKESIPYFTEIIENYEDNTWAYYYRINAYLGIGEFLEARKDALVLCALEEDNITYLEQLLGVEEYLDNYESIIECCNKLLALDTENAVYLDTRAHAKLKGKDFEGAIADYLWLEKMEESDEQIFANLYNNIGFAYAEMEDFDKAKDYLERCLDIEEHQTFAMNNLGYVLARMGEIENGLNWINRSLSFNPQNSLAYKNRAKVYLVLDRRDDAIRDLQTASDLDYTIHYDSEVDELLAGLM
jgi:tetratricopeptide (TPR) repeat protein